MLGKGDYRTICTLWPHLQFFKSIFLKCNVPGASRWCSGSRAGLPHEWPQSWTSCLKITPGAYTCACLKSQEENGLPEAMPSGGDSALSLLTGGRYVLRPSGWLKPQLVWSPIQTIFSYLNRQLLMDRYHTYHGSIRQTGDSCPEKDGVLLSMVW